MSGGGAFGPAAQAVGQANQTTPASGAAYTPVQQGSVYQPQYQQYQPQQRMPQYQQYQPQQRAPQYQQQMPNYQSGLQAAMMQMMQQYSRPMMRAPLQQGISPSSPLAYRPPAVNNTSRVAPSVELQRKQAEEAARQVEQEAGAPLQNIDYSSAP